MLRSGRKEEAAGSALAGCDDPVHPCASDSTGDHRPALCKLPISLLFPGPASDRAALVGFVLFSVVAFAYICLHRKVNQAAFFNNPQTTRLVTSIIVTFFVLWMPYLIINVLGVAAISLKNEGLLKFCMDSWNTAGALTFVNSCMNPLLYAFASRNMCTACQKRKHVVDAEAGQEPQEV